jgi:hypothetical protein
MAVEITEVRALTEVLKPYQFEIVIPEIPGGAGDPPDIVSLRCTSMTLPGRSIEPAQYALGGGHEVVDAGRTTFSRQWSVQLVESIDTGILQAIEGWQKLCFNQVTGIQSTSDEYKRDFDVNLLRNDGSVSLTRRYFGAFPLELGDLNFDHSSSEPITVDVTWSFDYWDDA